MVLVMVVLCVVMICYCVIDIFVGSFWEVVLVWWVGVLFVVLMWGYVGVVNCVVVMGGCFSFSVYGSSIKWFFIGIVFLDWEFFIIVFFG